MKAPDGTKITLIAKSESAVTIDPNSKTYNADGDDEVSFSYRLKLNGTGAKDSRSIKLEVTGACTVTVYCISGKSSETRTLALYDSDFSETTLDSQSVGGSDIVKITFTISEAGTYYLASTNSGINIYGIEITYTAGDAEAEG